MADFVITTAGKYGAKIETKTAKIDGVEYVVRNLGAGDQLTMMELARKIKKCQGEFEGIESHEDRVEIVAEMAELTLEMEKIYIDLFDDGTATRENSKKLVRAIGIEGAQKLHADIFAKKEV